MRIRHLISLLTIATTGLSTALAESFTFREFTGMCQGTSQGASLSTFIGWDRTDLPWHQLEPAPGEWNQPALEEWGQRILKLKEQNINFLPILSYNSPWSIDTEPRTITFGEDSKVVLRKLADGRLVREQHVRNTNGDWMRETAKIVEPGQRWALAQDKVADWENYVRRVVEYLSQPPYNLEYFQLWNEAHPESHFWQMGTMDEYMTRVHLPGAKIIRELGGKVVYGGWPVCGSIQEYIDLLDRHDAWKSIDVHDIHYFPLSAFEKLSQAAHERGLGTIPIWQTELGFTTNQSVIPNMWPRFMAWALRQGPDISADHYKLFWFPAWTPDDPKSYGYGRALLHGQTLSDHGLSLQNLGRVFSPGKIQAYDEAVESKPKLTAGNGIAGSAMETFRVGENRIVVALHLKPSDEGDGLFADWKGPRTDDGVPAVALRFQQLSPDDIKAIRVTDMIGRPIDITHVSSDQSTLLVPIAPTVGAPDWFASTPMTSIFVEIDLN